MFKKFSIFFFLFFFLFVTKTYALECKPGFTYNDQAELEQIKNLCEQKLNALSNQRNTLVSEIQYMDTQVYLTTLRISETEKKIEKTTEEIDTLSSKIEGLDESLNYLLKALLKRVVYGYKQHSVSPFSILLDSEGANDFLMRYKYLKTAQENNQKLLIQVQSAKTNYEEQKKMREEKKVELASLSALLSNQKAALLNQQEAKRRLLIDTQNDETIYQRLVAQARAQLSAFSSFVASSGLGAISTDPSWPSGYFSQRDSRWASQIIGGSTYDCNGHPCTVLEAGCLLSSVAMVLKSKGIETSPSQIASNYDFFSANTALMKFNLPNGMSRRQISVSEVDSRLNQGYVIVGINYGGCSYNSDHFVVLTKKEGNEYKMYDPLYGPDLNFSSHYSTICWAEVLE